MRKKSSETTRDEETGSPNSNSNTIRRELRNHLLGAFRSYPEQSKRNDRRQMNRMRDEFETVPLNQTTVIELKLTTEEALVLNEYAKSCRESLPDLIRKALIREATLADGYGPDDPQYEYGIQIADRDTRGDPLSAVAQRKIEEDTYNHFRSIFGWNKIKL
jgi:hypothetical protein